MVHFASGVVGNGGFAVVQRGIAGGGSQINEVFTAGMGIFIDFKCRVRVSALAVLGKLMLIEVRAVSFVGFGRSLALWGPIAEGRVYTFVE